MFLPHTEFKSISMLCFQDNNVRIKKLKGSIQSSQLVRNQNYGLNPSNLFHYLPCELIFRGNKGEKNETISDSIARLRERKTLRVGRSAKQKERQTSQVQKPGLKKEVQHLAIIKSMDFPIHCTHPPSVEKNNILFFSLKIPMPETYFTQDRIRTNYGQP